MSCQQCRVEGPWRYDDAGRVVGKCAECHPVEHQHGALLRLLRSAGTDGATSDELARALPFAKRASVSVVLGRLIDAGLVECAPFTRPGWGGARTVWRVAAQRDTEEVSGE